jgi:UDP-N-acetylmuramoyl-L-alanyl-D-glutamate--2,6-diaminopimelate ligase
VKRLKDILPETTGYRIHGDESVAINELTFDSREVKEGWLFVAKKGHVQDGRAFIPQAIQNGAKAIVLSEMPEEFDEKITWIEINDTNMAVAEMAAKFFDKPSQHLTVTGITGTNGKTSTAFLIYQMLNLLGQPAGLISTIDIRMGQEKFDAKLTTPDVISLNRLLAKCVDHGCRHAVLEASSHALDQGRLEGVDFDYALFTNISHDHLDYHGDMRSYIEAKKILFDRLRPDARAIINMDDKRAEVMVQNSKAKKVTCSQHRVTDYRMRVLGLDLEGMHLEVNDTQFHSFLIGEFNASNLLLAIATCSEMGFEMSSVLEKASMLRSAEGRFDVLKDSKGRSAAIIDFAHTPDALEKVLKTIRQLMGHGQKIITVVGCGGDRDKSKRPIMARIGAQYSSTLIVTSDNPRSEEPKQIIQEMLDGLDQDAISKTIAIEDRAQAIKTACRLRGERDIILVAGKGHEKYQEVNGIRQPFDDKQETQVHLKDI